MSTLDLGKLKFLWRGTWGTSSSYAQNDIVAYNSTIWICTQAHGTGLSTEFSPGKRDRANVLAKTVEPSEVIPIQVTVSSPGAGNFFYFDGRLTPQLTIYPNVRYRFYQKDSSNLNHRLAFSTTQDGFFTSGGTEYTTNLQQYGTPGIDGYTDFVLASNAPTTLYYFSAQDVGYGAGTTGRLLLSASWRGWQYWDQVTSGFNFRGAWTSITQYYYNDIIEYQGATYLALGDSIAKEPTTPTNSHFWQLMIPGDRRTEHQAAAWFMNKGPIDWPYPMGNNGNPNLLSNHKWISRSGRVYSHGAGESASHGIQYSDNGTRNDTYGLQGFPQEVCFNHYDWWASRDNGGTGRHTTPDGMPPKCIQIESGWTYSYYVFNNGEVYANGSNGSGELGVGDTTTWGTPRRVGGLSDVKITKLSCGFGAITATRHVLAVDENGYVWAWGRNNVGQLGTGDTANNYRWSPQRLPRSYFNGEKVVDVLAMGGDNGWSYARTEAGNLYSWGRNNEGQLGIGDTANRWRPVKITAFDPVVNAGIRKWQGYGYAGSCSLMILDGNGFLWHCGSDVSGHAAFAAATTRTTLTRSTAAPAGSIVNFWNVWSSDQTANVATFIRHSNGTTFVCGLASSTSNTHGTTGATTAITGPTLLNSNIGSTTGLINIKEIYLQVSFTSDNRRTIHWLRDDGRVFAQGNNSYNEFGNPAIGTSSSNNTDEGGSTNFPISAYTPSAHRIVQILPGGSGSTDLNWVHGTFYMNAIGQIFYSGMHRGTSSLGVVGADVRRWQGMFAGVQFDYGEGANTPMPLNIHYGR